MGSVDARFFNELLRHIGAPITETNVKACMAWQAAEGGTATFNPFDTTEPWSGASDYNEVGVKNYPNEDAGILATVATLQNGLYSGILAAFARGTSGLAVCEAVDVSRWGTHQAAAVYRGRFPDAP